jgi:hypothetical protein
MGRVEEGESAWLSLELKGDALKGRSREVGGRDPVKKGGDICWSGLGSDGGKRLK